MKKRLIKAGVLAGIFLAALIVSSLVINRGTDDRIIDMGAPSLPRVSFSVGDVEVNSLCGYVREMDMTTMRDTITPLDESGSLSVKIQEDEGQVQSVRYEVYSLDGAEKYADGGADIDEKDGTAVLPLKNVLPGPLQEGVLIVMLDTEDGDTVRYYTRIIMPDELVTADCLNFARDFHGKALAQDQSAGLDSFLEPGEGSDNTTYQTVNIHSDITHVLWGELDPQVLGETEWDIQEANSVYTSLLARYQVACKDDNGEKGVYNVREFFRIRSVRGTIYLLDYDRQMNKVFTANSQAFNEEGILLGITAEDVGYETNEKESMLAFVQERDLWLYDVKKAELTQVFSFADQEGEDVRSKNDRHGVRVISIDNEGNTAFAVYGYMSRGVHEGEVGVSICYFDKAEAIVTEKAFISSTSSAAITEETLGEMVYYAQARDTLYAMADGTLYEIDLKKNDKTALAEKLEEEDYVLSENGNMLAYRFAEEKEETRQIQVLDLESGEGYVVEPEKGEEVRPLGFINKDFVYGKINPEDKGADVSGREISPMYEVEIRSPGNKEEAKYSFVDEGLYTTDVLVEGNMLTLDRVKESKGRYQSADQEYITNNAEPKETKITLETYSTELAGTEMRFVFADGIKDTEPEVLKANQSAEEKTIELTLKKQDEQMRFYVYGMGSFAGIYDSAGDAVRAAEALSGVVVSSDQRYVWERGNRDLSYSTEASTFKKEDGETSLEACERYMESYEAKKIDLTGCTLDEVLYVINKGCPVIAFESDSHAVLLTGYSTTDVTYIDPDTGKKQTVGISTMKKRTEDSGNIFIGYIR